MQINAVTTHKRGSFNQNLESKLSILKSVPVKLQALVWQNSHSWFSFILAQFLPFLALDRRAAFMWDDRMLSDLLSVISVHIMSV